MKVFSDIREIGSLTRQQFEDRCTAFTDHVYLGNNLVLCKILTKYKMFVDTRDIGVAPHLIMDGYWESWITQCLARIVKTGDVCVDVGANFGYYSLLMSELSGLDGRTVAIEPNPRVVETLRSSEVIHSSRFDVIQSALGDKTGEATLTFPDKYMGGGTLLQQSNFEGKTQVKVKITTFDELVARLKLPKVDVVKMDVEGLEPLVFAGMKNTLANNPNLKMIIEYSPFSYSNKKEFSDYLFSNFIINRIKDVADMETLDKEAMDRLIELTDHTDFYLIRK